MKTEYLLTDEQKKQIHELNQKIFDLQMQISSIYLMANVRYITETEEEAESVRKYICFDDVVKKQGIVKINKSEV